MSKNTIEEPHTDFNSEDEDEDNYEGYCEWWSSSEAVSLIFLCNLAFRSS